jgi:hypothetical protein
MIDYSKVLSIDLWEPESGERLLGKSLMAKKIMENDRSNYNQCMKYEKCIFCSLKGENKEHEELIEVIIIDYIKNFNSKITYGSQDYIDPIGMVGEIMNFVYGNNVTFSYSFYPNINNITPLMNEMLKRGVTRSELDKILDKFKYIPPSDSSLDDLPF